MLGGGLALLWLIACQRSRSVEPDRALRPLAESLALRVDAAVAGARPTAVTATPPLTAAELGQWREHLRAGRKHADAREWAPGVREFEAALKLTPEDATAANELAWAALQAGDIAKARKAGEAALRGAADALALREKKEAQMKAVLTPAQYERYTAMKKEKRSASMKEMKQAKPAHQE